MGLGRFRLTFAVADGLAASSKKQIRILAVRKRTHAASLCGLGGRCGAATVLLDEVSRGGSSLSALEIRAVFQRAL